MLLLRICKWLKHVSQNYQSHSEPCWYFSLSQCIHAWIIANLIISKSRSNSIEKVPFINSRTNHNPSYDLCFFLFLRSSYTYERTEVEKGINSWWKNVEDLFSQKIWFLDKYVKHQLFFPNIFVPWKSNLLWHSIKINGLIERRAYPNFHFSFFMLMFTLALILYNSLQYKIVTILLWYFSGA